VGAVLQVEMAFQPTSCMPAAAQRGSSAAETAARLRERYERIYYQVMQTDIQVCLLTTLEQAPSSPPLDLPAGREPMRAYVAGAYAYLNAASCLASVPVDLTACASLKDVADRYGVGFDDIAAAHADVAISAILARPASPPLLKLPRYATFRAGDTVRSRCPSDPVGVLTADENIRLPLHTGTELVIQRRTGVTPREPVTITELAKAANCGVASLILANARQAPLLRVGLVFEMEGTSVAVASAEITLDDVARTFREAGILVDTLMIGAAYADVEGVFAAAQTFGVDRWTIKEHETLIENGSGNSVSQLAQNNIDTADLFFSGTSLYVETIDGSAAFGYTVAAAAQTYGIPARQLLAHNATAALAPAAALIVPGQSRMRTGPDSLRIPYTCQTDDTLAQLAGRFVKLDVDDAVLALATANERVPYLIERGKTVTVGSQTIDTVQGDSLADVVDRFDPPVTLAQVVAVIGNNSGYLASGALLLCPPACLDASAPATPARVGQLYGMSPGTLAIANAGLVHTIAAGKTLSLERDGHAVQISTGAGDNGVTQYTFNSLVRLFSEQGVETTIDEIVSANATVDFLAAGAMLLLPPHRTTVSAPFGQQGWSVPGSIFAVHAWLDLRRDPALVLPDFRGTAQTPAPAVACRSAISPFGTDAAPAPGDTRRSPLRLQGFAAALEAAVPPLRVCSGKVRRAGDRDTAAGDNDVWAVAFGPGFIEQVDIQPPRVNDTLMPRFFALRPLFNHPVTRSGIEIKPLTNTGIYGDGKPTDFQGVDVDTWAGNFLDDLDLFLSAAYAVPAYQLSNQEALQDILDTKALLALAVANGIDYVLELGQPSPTTQPPDWVAARDVLKQQLLVSPGRAWATDVMLQYDVSATVASRWTPLQARLSGSMTLRDTADGRDARRVSMTGAKTSLMTDHSFLTFAATVQRDKTLNADDPPAVAQQSFLALDPGYDVNEVEFDIHPVAAGYDASNWLSFVRPLSGTDIPPGWHVGMGPTRAPVPLRAYPSPATLVGHAATASHPHTTDWRETVFWTYGSTFRHQSAAQDQIRIEVEFNRSPPVATQAVEQDDLFAALAQYDAIRAPLWEFFKQIPALDTVADPTPIEYAVQLFADLIRTRIRPLWAQHWHIDALPDWARRVAAHAARNGAQAKPTNEIYRFLVTLVPEPSPDGYRYATLVLNLESAQGALSWPDISVTTPDGIRYHLDPRSPVHRETGSTSQYYDFPPDSKIAVGTQLDYLVEFSGLHVAVYENATSQASVMRNAHLLGPEGPLTRDGFVYVTPPVSFPDLATPSLIWDAKFAIGPWNQQGTPLSDLLSAAVNDDITGDRKIAIGARYGFELVPGAIVTALPVFYRPRFGYTGVQGAEVASRVQTWQRINHPATAGGEWIFDVTLFAALEPQRQAPLFELKNAFSLLQNT
jgi:hypothetical protein